MRELVTPLFGPGRPTWSADSATLAFASVRPYSQRFREGVSQILVVDVATGAQRYVEPGDRHASLSTRGDDGPVWSPDGKELAFVMGSQLHVMPVDATGTPTGAPRRVNREVADAPSWSGDSRTAALPVPGPSPPRERPHRRGPDRGRAAALPAGRPQRTPGRPRRTVLGRPGQEAAPRRRHHRRRQPDPEHHPPPPAPLRQGGRRIGPDRHAGPDGLPRPPGLRVALLRRPPGPGQPGVGHHLDALGRRPGLPRDGGPRLVARRRPGGAALLRHGGAGRRVAGLLQLHAADPDATPRSGAS